MQKHINDKRKCGECNHFAMNWCWDIGVNRKKDDNCTETSQIA